MKTILKMLSVGMVLISLTGCGPSRIALKPSFWDNKEQKIGIAFIKYPEAGAHRQGSEGLLDMAINASLASEMSAYLKSIDVEAYEEVAQSFKEKFASKGIEVQIFKGKLDLETLEDTPRSSGRSLSSTTFKKDLSFMKQKFKIDKVLLLGVDAYGTLRNYYGFIPLGAPKALFKVSGQLVDLESNNKEWFDFQDQEYATAPVMGEWNQPPTYPNLTNALIVAMNNAKEYIIRAFFADYSVPEKVARENK